MNRNPEFSYNRSFYPGNRVSGALSGNFSDHWPESATKIVPLPLTLPGDGTALTNMFAGVLDDTPIVFERFLDNVIQPPNEG